MTNYKELIESIKNMTVLSCYVARRQGYAEIADKYDETGNEIIKILERLENA